MASAEWYGSWLRLLVDGFSERESISNANEQMNSSRDFARCKIKDRSNNLLMLSAAVEGGGRQLRSIENFPKILLSNHGNWRKTHQSAIEACYGKKPFYPYLSIELQEIYYDESIKTLEDFCNSLHQRLILILVRRLDVSKLKLIDKDERLKERAKEIAKDIDPKISVLDALMSYGPETILGLYGLGI